MPDYAAHRIIHLFDVLPELMFDLDLREAKQHLLQVCQSKFSLFTALRGVLRQDASKLNCHPE